MLRVRYRLCLIDIEREAPKFGPGFGDVLELSREVLMNDQDAHGRSTHPQAFLGMLSNGAEQVVDDAPLAGLYFCGDG